MDTAAKTDLLRRAALALRDDDALHQRLTTQLADWLTAEADIQDSVPQVAQAVADLVATIERQGMDVSVAASTLDHAVTVAAAILGDGD
jgi:chemotaxis regulatin CheY-phosphate phosphatase CheZ